MNASVTEKSHVLLATGERRKVTYAWADEEKLFRAFLDQHMSGQDDIKDALVDILSAIRNPLRDKTLPIYSVLMVGPSTSGKTLGFKLLVQWVKGSREKMLFFSGSDYQEKHQLNRLIGAPPGYTGFVDVKDPKYVAPKPGEKDFSAGLAQHNLDNTCIGTDDDDVVFMLFDEWEKFHFDFNQFMLRPLREGTAEMGNTSVTKFYNCVIGFTSNLGSDELDRLATPVGFTATKREVTKDAVREVVVRHLKRGYPPEFRNRIGKVLFFTPLTNKELVGVVGQEVQKLIERICAQKTVFKLDVDVNASLWLLKNTDAEEKGPIPAMQQKFEQYLVGPLGLLMRNGVITRGDFVEVTHLEGEDELTFYVTEFPEEAVEESETPVSEQPADAANSSKVNAGVGQGGAAAGADANATSAKEPGTALAVMPKLVGVDCVLQVSVGSLDEPMQHKMVLLATLLGMAPIVTVTQDTTVYGQKVPVLGGVMVTYLYQVEVTSPLEMLVQLKKVMPVIEVIIKQQPLEL